MKNSNLNYIKKFENLSYEQFKEMALDQSLLPHEKVGFPDAYRSGKESLIWQDIQSKLSNLALSEQIILDIGPGCSELPHYLLNQASKNNSKVILCDSKEMLSHLPDDNFITKVEGPFPDCWASLSQYFGKMDIIIVYSVLHYVFTEGNIEHFVDRCLELLAEGGQLLLGDLPNYSKRKRFFESAAGKKFHLDFVDKHNSGNEPIKESLPKPKIDDLVILSLTARARNQGFNAYVLPQHPDLPMANRREDILIMRP